MRLELGRQEETPRVPEQTVLPPVARTPARVALGPSLVEEPSAGLTRTFHVDIAKLKTAAAALVLTSALGAEAKPAAQPNRYPTREAKWQAESEIRNEALEAAGKLKAGLPAQPEEKFPLKSVAIGTLLAGVMAFGVKKAQEQAKREDLAAERAALSENLQSPYAGVRRVALEAIGKRPDLAQFDLPPLLRLAIKDPDHSVRVAATTVLAQHPDTPEPTLRWIAVAGQMISIRAMALGRLDQFNAKERRS